jgi:two-component system phosphate regulon sensor histidine kinase PhoR
MNQRYSTALQLSLLIIIVFSLIVGITFYLYNGSLDPLFQATNYVVICLLTLFIFSFVIIQLIIENFILTKVKSLYQDLLPTGIPLNEDSLQKDVISITQSLQKFAKESKLEIELLKDKENYRREFIGNLAHELKTPLFTVQGFILTLLDNDLTDRKMVKKYLKKAASGVDRLGFIINDLDLITQFETGVTTLNIEQFNIADLIKDIIEMLEIKAKKSGINLQFNSNQDGPTMVQGDIERLTQVITNLVINSFKYGVENGTTEIEISELNETKILVRVIDNGKGIAEEHLPRLFERFYRVDKTRNRNEGGSGLGLAIVKHIIEAHNEKIFVESTLKVGSEFSFTLSRSKA